MLLFVEPTKSESDSLARLYIKRESDLSEGFTPRGRWSLFETHYYAAPLFAERPPINIL